MKNVNNENDSRPVAMLTVAELLARIKTEIQAALRASAQRTSIDGNPGQKEIAPNKPYLTVNQAAEVATVSPSTIRLYIRKGYLKPQRLGRRVIVARAELERLMDSQSSKVVELYST